MRQQLRFSQRFECKHCNLRYEEPEPRLFSFNNPYGACARCQGFGNTIDFDLDLVIPDKTKSLGEGAIDPWNKPKYRPVFTEMKTVCQTGMRFRWMCRGENWRRSSRNLILNGEGDFLGVRGFFQYLERKKYKLHVRVFLEPVSRIFDLSGMPWKPAAAGSEAGQNQRPQYLRRVRDDGGGCGEVF